ncbi:ATP-dependent DNA/RNA helicase DHX36 [Cottoperca gobio]|uniref:ATP-dependent DNA/RNA helicase DHX36 n=1 Tax=Cottoperca gobio TaxID=56716 RepID=A0A6J2PD66_COTGO|nr:ATP-dependent DNA/RNA helicase DHX36 [Cottoperca gobio]
MSNGYGGGGGRRGRRGGRGGRGYRDGSRERWDRGGGGGRGYRDGSRERWDRGGGGGSREQHSDFDQDRGGGGGGGGGGGQRDRPPPHLKGREIGLWYARYGAVRRKQADRTSRAVVQMDAAREQHITKLLNSVQNDQPGPARDGRDARASTSDSWRAAANSSGHCYFDGDVSEEDKLKIEFKSEDEEEEVTPGQKKTTRCFSSPAAEDEPPDAWDKEEQQEKEEQEKEEKEKLRRKDKDLEFLYQEVVRDSSLDERLKRDLQSKKSDAKYKEMLKFREKLPSYKKKEELVQLINSNRVLVVSGETGCGKTTQVTQFILDDYINRGVGSMCRVVCTQPRRISAISVAERVAAERAESVGNGNSCGYQIRLQSRLPRRQGSVLYCTTGIILQWLRSDTLLSSISHLVLDEIHERNLQSDVLLVIVKDILAHRDDLKIVLMSATLNAEKFSKYFDNCPIIHIPGLTFPVEEFLLEDIVEMTRYRPQNKNSRPSWKKGFLQGRQSRPEKEEKEAEYKESWPCYARSLQDRYSENTIETLEALDNDEKIDLQLILALIHHIVLNDEEGAILVFLPGWDNISSLNDLLTAQQMFRSDRFVIIPLHSLMPTVNQTQCQDLLG